MNGGLPRAIEAPAAAVALVFALPLLAVVALSIRLGSPGSVLFRQERVGRSGSRFLLTKFRTMRPSREPGLGVTARDDDRVTVIGRLLRRSKLDELPELWNVLRGDMSLVGPRPEVPSYVDIEDPLWQRALSVRPGLVDPNQVRLRDEEGLMAGIAADREGFYLGTLQRYKLLVIGEYLQHRTWLSDLQLIGATLVAFVAPSLTAPPASLAEIRQVVDSAKGA